MRYVGGVTARRTSPVFARATADRSGMRGTRREARGEERRRRKRTGRATERERRGRGAAGGAAGGEARRGGEELLYRSSLCKEGATSHIDLG